MRSSDTSYKVYVCKREREGEFGGSVYNFHIFSMFVCVIETGAGVESDVPFEWVCLNMHLYVCVVIICVSFAILADCFFFLFFVCISHILYSLLYTDATGGLVRPATVCLTVKGEGEQRHLHHHQVARGRDAAPHCGEQMVCMDV
jgi:hypothetical protein